MNKYQRRGTMGRQMKKIDVLLPRIW